MGLFSPDIVLQIFYSVRGQRLCEIFTLWLTLTSFVISTGTEASGLTKLLACGGTLEDSGNIQSPNYPSNYPNDVRCYWRLLRKSIDTGIKIQFTSFDVENTYDYVNIYDEKNISKRYTGKVLPPMIFAGKEARIEFYSDGVYTMRGFTAIFVSINVTNENQCMTSEVFWCTTEKKCISSNWQCDGYPDCKFREDELLCPSTTTRTTLSSQSDCERFGYYWCSRSNQCIPTIYKCNDRKDCVFGEDETDCTTRAASITGIAAGVVCLIISLFFISCRIKKCIRKRQLRQSNHLSSNRLQTATTPSATVWSTSATTASSPGASSVQDSDPVRAENLPMDQLAPPSYDDAMKAYTAGQFANTRNQYSELQPSAETPNFTDTLVK